MTVKKAQDKKKNTVINKLEVTSDTMTGRGGLNLFVKYLSAINLYSILTIRFSGIRKSKKGAAIQNMFQQLFCFFIDGTSSHLTHFDHLKQDSGYAAIIETQPEEMVSSHQVKRFMNAFPCLCHNAFRFILKHLFVWRLRLECPPIVFLMLDTMVMDNDDALKRQGVSATYKKKKGFQPLHLIWEGKIVDALFRGGSKHGNSGTAAKNMLVRSIRLIRSQYSETVPIIVRMDSGFFDTELFHALDKHGVGFIASGKLYKSVKDFMSVDTSPYHVYDNGKQMWDYKEFGFRCNDWEQFYQAFYTRLTHVGKQYVLDFARPDNVILTNITTNPRVKQSLIDAEMTDLLRPQQIIANHHLRGADELPHRSLKDFASQKLPFQKFNTNAAWYYCMILSLFVFESFKEDNLIGLVDVGAYPTTVRRIVIDIAAKIVRKSHYVILKVTRDVMDRLDFAFLWKASQQHYYPIRLIF